MYNAHDFYGNNLWKETKIELLQMCHFVKLKKLMNVRNGYKLIKHFGINLFKCNEQIYNKILPIKI